LQNAGEVIYLHDACRWLKSDEKVIVTSLTVAVAQLLRLPHQLCTLHSITTTYNRTSSSVKLEKYDTM